MGGCRRNWQLGQVNKQSHFLKHTHALPEEHKPGNSFLQVDWGGKGLLTTFPLGDGHPHPTGRLSKHTNLGERSQGQEVKSWLSDSLLELFLLLLTPNTFITEINNLLGSRNVPQVPPKPNYDTKPFHTVTLHTVFFPFKVCQAASCL